MSIGKNLSSLRRKNGLTQQQLGDMLNISAQAVSKWENELAEPDLATVKKIASIYKISVDEILDTDIETALELADAEVIAESVTESISEKIVTPIGFCKACGITVTNDNFGTDTPSVMCKKCHEKHLENIRAQENAEKAERERRRFEVLAEANGMRRLRRLSIIFGSIIGIIVMILGIIVGGVGGIVTGVLTYTFVSLCFFEDSKVRDILEFMGGASINWPGLIWEFDLDGFLWMIGMKILFAVLGFLIGAVCAVLGFFVAFFFSILEYPFFMVGYHKEIKEIEGK